MNRFSRPLLGLVPYRAFTLLAAAVLAACNRHVPAQERATAVATLNVSCEPQDGALNCRAIGQRADESADGETDMTDAVAWSTSNVKTAAIVRGRVTANEPGTATIVASVRSGNETVSSSVLVVVDGKSTRPQLAYDLNGVVRELSNDGLTNVELTLVDDQDRARSVVTSGVDGSFRFVPLVTGQYRLRATKEGYRPAERLVSVPDATPLTLVLLSEPK